MQYIWDQKNKSFTMKTAQRHTHFILLGRNTITLTAKDRGRGKLSEKKYLSKYSFLQTFVWDLKRPKTAKLLLKSDNL